MAMTQEHLKKIMNYNPLTGVFVWIVDRQRSASGDQVGFVRKDGYMEVTIYGIQHLMHRLAWLYITGSFPDNEIDHLNSIRADNRLVNFRDVTRLENARNRKLSVNNTSGFNGVCWNKNQKVWIAKIKLNGKYKYLGGFVHIDDAITAREAANIAYGFHPLHGKK